MPIPRDSRALQRRAAPTFTYNRTRPALTLRRSICRMAAKRSTEIGAATRSGLITFLGLLATLHRGVATQYFATGQLRCTRRRVDVDGARMVAARRDRLAVLRRELIREFFQRCVAEGGLA